MTFITAASLRRTFGLSVLQASTIITRQRSAALSRYRTLEWAAHLCLLGAAVVVVFGWPLPLLAQLVLWFTGLSLACLRLVLVHRVSRVPILAAARAAAGMSPITAPLTSSVSATSPGSA